METAAQRNEQLKICLNEAIDLLDDIKDKLGMFQTQRYYRLKKEIELISADHNNIAPETGKSLIFLS